MDDTQSVIDVRNSLAQVFNDAVQTHGPAVAMASVTIFAAAAVHQATHMMDDQKDARWIALGRWADNFHAHLEYLNAQCDKHPKMPLPPLNGFEGQA